MNSIRFIAILGLVLLLLDKKFVNGDGLYGVGERIYKVEQRVNDLNSKYYELLQRRRVMYYYWPSYWTSNVDSGTVVSLSFYKRESYTQLRVTWSGVLGLLNSTGTGGRCNRWYFTFNGQECSSRGPIDTLVYQSSPTTTVQQSAMFSGQCYVSVTGRVTVALKVGACSGITAGNAQTCWKTGCSMTIEEV